MTVTESIISENKNTQNILLDTSLEALDSIVDPLENANELPEVEQIKPKSTRSKKWKCLGSDMEIEQERVVSRKEVLAVQISRRYAEFGHAFQFEDVEIPQTVEFKSYKDPNYDLHRMELQVGIQAVSKVEDSVSQTTWYRPVNFACQYEAIEMDSQAKEAVLSSEGLETFLLGVSPSLEGFLQQNELLNIFQNDYVGLGEEEVIIEQGSHTILSEYQSFTDLIHSKDMCISCVDWHPVHRGVVAVSCSKSMTFDERIQTRSTSRKSCIIVWSFQDPIHPQLLLLAPADVICFSFNPNDSNIVAGGCVDGQVVLWDISEFQESLGNSRSSDGENNATEETENKQTVVPTVKYISVSAIEFSHRNSITDIQWLPKNFELEPNGEVAENGESGDKQLVTCSIDGTVAAWDIRYKKDLKSLDLAWRPFIRIPLSTMDNSSDYSISKISLNTRSADKEIEETDNKNPKRSRISKFYAATEEGDLILSDWVAEKVTEEKTSRVEGVITGHHGAISDICRSPFFPDIILSTGGWSFHVWKEFNHKGPLLSSTHNPCYTTFGKWSPTRAGVFFIGRSDGMLEIWDLLDRSSGPLTVQNIAATSLTSLSIKQYSGKNSNQYLAIGDDIGTLHIMEVPKNLSRSSRNEKLNMAAYFERETKRVLAFSANKAQHEKNRAAFEQAQIEANKKTNENANPVAKTEAEFEAEEKLFQTLELSFLEENGMIAPAAD